MTPVMGVIFLSSSFLFRLNGIVHVPTRYANNKLARQLYRGDIELVR
jgi:hypothetical protein